MPISTFFVQQCCDRCGGELGEKRTLSFFPGEVFCKYCSANEQEEKKKKIIEGDEDPTTDPKTQPYK
jgi:hypothetical protein